MGLAPQLVKQIFEIVAEINRKEGVTILLAEQNTNIALQYAEYAYILENGHFQGYMHILHIEELYLYSVQLVI